MDRTSTCSTIKVLAAVALAVACALPAPVLAAKGKGSFPYVKKNSWAESMLASRDAYAAYQTDSDAKPDIVLGPWWTTGPVKTKKFGEKLFPEKGIDLESKSDQGRNLWLKVEKIPDNRVFNLPRRETPRHPRQS